MELEKVEKFMSLLLEAGFPLQYVLKKGFQYAINTDWMQAAQVVNQAAKNLHIDSESQREALQEARYRYS